LPDWNQLLVSGLFSLLPLSTALAGTIPALPKPPMRLCLWETVATREMEIDQLDRWDRSTWSLGSINLIVGIDQLDR